MTFKDQFRFVRQNMKKNKTRLFMTILATAIGCTFLIVLASVGFGLHKSIIQDLMENRLVTEMDVHGKEDDAGNVDRINDRHIEYFEALDGVKTVTRRQVLQQNPIFTLDGYQISTETVAAHFPSEIEAGFKLSKGRLPEKKNEIVVGHAFPEELSPEAENGVDLYQEDGTLKEEFAYKGNIIGKTVDMEVMKIVDGKESTTTIPLKIVGIAEKPAKEWLQISTVFISESTLKQVEDFTGTPGGFPEQTEKPEAESSEKTYDEVKIYANNVEAVSGIQEKLDADNYLTYSIVSEMKQMNMLFTIMKIGLIFVGTIALLIASIGIYNTMSMAVTERAPDIGIMKAVGATPKTIKNIFLLESSYIGLIGAFIGTVVAYGISSVVNFSLPLVLKLVFDDSPPDGLQFSYIPLSLTMISIVICLVVTIFSGWKPAQRATQVDVLKAMRREI